MPSTSGTDNEVAYYFAALALGLLAVLSTSITVLTAGLMILIVATLFVGDHPGVFRHYRQQTMELDVAHTDEVALRAHLEMLLDAPVANLVVKHVDLVNDTTLVRSAYVVGPVRTTRPAVELEQVAR